MFFFFSVFISISVFSSVAVHRDVMWFHFSMLHLKPATHTGAGVSKQRFALMFEVQRNPTSFPTILFPEFSLEKVKKLNHIRGLTASNRWWRASWVQTPVWALSICLCVPTSTLSPPFPIIYLRLVAGGRTSYLNQSSFAGTGFLHLVFSLLSRSLTTVPAVVVWVSHSGREATTMKVISVVGEASLL